ncbi:MAG: SCO family protein [Lewinella sp.]|nr:SCO family protein [Lewinella sp.]
MKTFSWLPISLLLFAAGCREAAQYNTTVGGLPYFNEATFTPHWLGPDSDSLATFHRISPFELIDQQGEMITEQTFSGKIYIADFFFTSCPGICPKMTKNMGVLQDEFLEDENVLLLSHSVTPEHDSVPVLKAYAEENGVVTGKWHLVTGPQEQIYKLGRKDYFVEEDLGLEKAVDDFLHTENFVLVDQDRHIRGIYNGLNSASVQQLIADVHLLEVALQAP